MLLKTNFQPGINRETTQYATGFGWYDGDKIRFRMGRVEQIGGWEKLSDNAFIGVARSLHDWTTTGSVKYLGIGTTYKVYVYLETNDTYYDITPIRTASPNVINNNPFTATAEGSSEITVEDTAHGALVGDFVTFSGATGLGTNIIADVLNQEYQIVTVVDDDNYTIAAKDTSGNEVLAAADDDDAAGGGASVDAEYQMNTGTSDYVFAEGWGSGAWLPSAWGGGSAAGYGGQIRLFSQDNFGDDLIFNPRGGNIYFWDVSEADAASYDYPAVTLDSLASAAQSPPTIALQIMVSQVDGHVIAFGCDAIGAAGVIDPMFIRWSDQDNHLDWYPAIDKSAGSTKLTNGSEIVSAVRTRQEIIIFTDNAMYAMRFVGGDFVFQFSPIAENVTTCSPNAAIPAGDAVFFMDTDGFYVYRGAVQRLPCTVLKYVFENIDKTQLYKVFAVNNPDDSEVTWFYPSLTLNGNDVSSPAENNSYVTYNYLEQSWSIGTMARGAWIQTTARDYPVASSANRDDENTQYLYSHEKGHTADGADMGAYIESGQFEIAEGDRFSFIKRVIPDFRYAGTTANANFTMEISSTDFPQITPTVKSTVTIRNTGAVTDGQQHVRVRGREAKIKITANDSGYGWTMGDFRLDMRTDGKR